MSTKPLFHAGLVAMDAGSASVESSTGALPTRIVVAKWGSVDTAKGRITINETSAREVPRNQKLANFDRVALDFNHNTVPGSESYKGEPAKVAAYASPIVESGIGIVFQEVDWTDEGRHFVGGKHYIDLSPTLQLNAQGEAVFIHSAAVCRQGAIPGLSLFSADPLTGAAVKTGRTREVLCTLIGVPPDVTDEQLARAARTIGEPLSGRDVTREAWLEDRVIKTVLESGGLNERNCALINAMFPEPEKIIGRVLMSRLGLSAEQIAKYGGV